MKTRRLIVTFFIVCALVLAFALVPGCTPAQDLAGPTEVETVEPATLPAPITVQASTQEGAEELAPECFPACEEGQTCQTDGHGGGVCVWDSPCLGPNPPSSCEIDW